jgi:hypothetical protein
MAYLPIREAPLAPPCQSYLVRHTHVGHTQNPTHVELAGRISSWLRVQLVSHKVIISVYSCPLRLEKHL